jgi:hypothetical protein
VTALASLLGDPASLLRRVTAKAPEPAAIRRAAASIAGQVGAAPDAERTAELQLRVAAQIRSEGVEAVSRRDLRQSCRTFLHAPHPPAADPDLAQAIVGRVSSTHRRAAFFALLDCYLDGYRAGDEAVRRLSEWLKVIAAGWPWRPGDQWKDRLGRFDLLDGASAAERLAKAVLTSTTGHASVLEQAGLDMGTRPRGGLAEAAFRTTCRSVATMAGARAEQAQAMLLRWSLATTGTISFPASWVDLVRACVTPWISHEPGAQHKAHLLAELERLGGGDPRIPGSGRWPEVAQDAPDAYALLLRWLTRASVMQFLEVVDRSLREPDARRMWSYRRAFWTSYLLNESGPRIERAWVAFGADGARLARAAARETGDKSLSVFGNQSEKSGQHAALILEIGDLLVVDWSHSGKYNIWRRGERGRPSLFRLQYDAGELDSAPLRESHSSPSTYSWQKKLAQVIEGRVFYSEKASWRPSRV